MFGEAWVKRPVVQNMLRKISVAPRRSLGHLPSTPDMPAFSFINHSFIHQRQRPISSETISTSCRFLLGLSKAQERRLRILPKMATQAAAAKKQQGKRFH